ncbi:MAG: hypothetical protein COU11_03280 [Candidatus Harrisonbacteria bacterium CG10_big_fil_rev_8_21_14_0_10_49_15]|uniref:YebC/PmpR family DNA-binding transcriptional regulator n=1 Tax=Candidatus Harrisonbacteria bacterium CG10_big_fil_rev_8_21_14_0_10_49_15 TaxID=1974587 RepID=A0A2H0UKC7_9BACT|nr:MAG: hypothetical protein COU11_03280 [Candidatus Harrisonbacteria bacterium CG10_big_fil_rev_8_21_14_0_10_49_15]
MAGHSKWKQIKHKKEAQDKKKGATFSKFLAAISSAARTDANPDTNPTLRSLIEQAGAANVPQENITRALSRQQEKDLSEFTMEAYGPEGVALIITCATDNTNRINHELRKIITDAGGKIADPGSVLWAFAKTTDSWIAKFPQAITESSQVELSKLTQAIKSHPDVQSVFTNAANSHY